MEYVIVAALAVLLILVLRASFDMELAGRVQRVLVAAFVVRLAVHVLVMRTGIIGYGGDNHAYELTAMEIVELWKREGLQFVTEAQIGSISSVAVPCHVFAIVIYLCAGPAPLACTAVVAFMACVLCVMMYKFARLVGADEGAAFRLLVILAFMPAFLVHTSDMYKDGFNAFLVIGCLGLAASNVQHFDIRKVIMIGPLLWALWNVRPYMVFMCGLPLLLGIVNPRRTLSLRLMVVALCLPITALVMVADIGDNTPATIVQQELAHGQAEDVRRSNASGDSGVQFDDGGNAWSTLAPKLLYTLLSPFPWMDGSLTLQLGKIDALLLYYLLFCAVQGARRLWSHDYRMLFLLLLFIVPSTIAYATTMANIGLIFRQRMPIVMAVSLLAAVAWTKVDREKERSSEVDGKSTTSPSLASLSTSDR